MNNNEFTILMNTVRTTISIGKLDELEMKVPELLTPAQLKKFMKAKATRRDELVDWKTFEDHMNCTDCIDTTADDGELKFTNERDENMGKTETKEEPKNEVVTNGETTATATGDKKIDAAVSRIEKKIGTIEKGYLGIVGDVAYLAENDGAKTLGYKNIYELCADKFGMARGTVHNLLSIYKRFGDGNYGLTAEANGMGVRALLAQITNERDARKALEDNGGASVTDGDDGESESNNASGDSNNKRVDVIDFDFTNMETWSIDDLLDKIREEIEAGGITEVDKNSNIIFKITH